MTEQQGTELLLELATVNQHLLYYDVMVVVVIGCLFAGIFLRGFRL